MSSPPPYQPGPTNPLKRPSISAASSQSNIKRPRNHPLRQTSFPSSTDPDTRPFSALSDGGSVNGSFTGSLDGGNISKAKKRGRKSKAEKEREREDAASGADTRLGSADLEAGGAPSGGGGQPGEEEAEDDDLDDEGELLGREEGVTDVEAEKKNLAYVLFLLSLFFDMREVMVANDLNVGYSLMHSTLCSRNDMIFTNGLS